MADLKYDLVLPEGRHGLWTALHQEEEKTRRDARIGKIQNLPAALIYVFNVLLVTGFVTNYFAGGIAWLTNSPVFGGYIRLVQDLSDGKVLWVLAALIATALVIPWVLAALLRLVISRFVKQEVIIAPVLPEREEEQLYAIMRKINAMTRDSETYKTPMLVLLGVPAIGGLAGAIIHFVSGLQSGDAWYIAILWALLFFVVYCVAAFALGLLYSALGFSQPLPDDELTNHYSAAEKRRNELKPSHRYRNKQ
jgi:hypothetical protein